MLDNHLFWMAVSLFFLSAINFNAFLEYHKTVRILPTIIGLAGLFGFIGWLVRVISLSLMFNWWWFLGLCLTSLIFTGVFSFFTRNKISFIIGALNIVFIPFVWWYGSKFNSTHTFDWFYNSLDAIQRFFS